MKIQASSSEISRRSFPFRWEFSRPLVRSFSGLALLWCAVWPASSRAQTTGAPLPLPGAVQALESVAPAAPSISILILAFDELGAPTPIQALPPAPTVLTPTVPDPAPPAIVPVAPPALAPAQWNGFVPGVRWESSAQRKKKKDDVFTLMPEPGGLVTRPVTPPSVVAVPNPAPNVALEPLAPEPPAPAGRAQIAAVSLRRALMARRFDDVLTVTPQSTSITRALVERRLTPRVMRDLQNALQTLNAPGAPNADASARATRAAARIGQALGYRAVIALHVAAPVAGEAGARRAAWNIVLADGALERGEPIGFEQPGVDEAAILESGALTAATTLERSLRGWPTPAPAAKIALAQSHYQTARALLTAGDAPGAQDELKQSIALDPTRGEAFLLLGETLQQTDPQGSANAFRRAVELSTRDGATLEKIAIAYANAKTPDWPRALDAGTRALAAGTDSVALRVALATTQFGRAALYRRADRLKQAEDANIDARRHLDRALELGPDDPSAVTVLTQNLIENRRFDEALFTLDRVAPRFPRDVRIQTLYARALASRIEPGREEDAFVAYSRVWKLTGQIGVDIDALDYRRLAAGFDVRVDNLGKLASLLVSNVASGSVTPTAALLQLTRLKEDMSGAEAAINVVRPPASVNPEIVNSRIFAADLMNQALEAYQTYLDVGGQEIYRSRGRDLHRQAIGRINAARTLD